MRAAHDDQRVPALQRRAQRRGADGVEQHVVLTLEVFQRVGDKGLELLRKSRSGQCHRRVDGSRVGDLAGRNFGVGPVEHSLVQAQHLAVGDELQEIGPEVVHQRNACGEQDLRTQVRVATADARCGVDHGGRPTGHQSLGADPVDVHVVDDRDLTGAQPLDEVLRAALDPDHRNESRLGGRSGTARARQPHGGIVTRCTGVDR